MSKFLNNSYRNNIKPFIETFYEPSSKSVIPSIIRSLVVWIDSVSTAV